MREHTYLLNQELPVYSPLKTPSSRRSFIEAGQPHFLAGSKARSNGTHSQTAAVVRLERSPNGLLTYKSNPSRSPCHSAFNTLAPTEPTA